MTQFTVILKGTPLHERASWIYRNGKWVCCGATRNLAEWVTELSMGEVTRQLLLRNQDFVWKHFQ